jgi:mitochondrial inner membrane protease ATP23
LASSSSNSTTAAHSFPPPPKLDLGLAPKSTTMAWWTTTKAPSTSGPDQTAATLSSFSSSPTPTPTPTPTNPTQSAAQQNQPPANAYLENDPARTGFDPKTQWWVNYFKILTGQVTKEGIFHYREDRYRANEGRDVKRCEEYRDWLFAYSPTVRFLNDKIAELNHGQAMTPSNVLCRRCPARLTADRQVERQSGGFEPRHGILVCANEVRNRGHLEDTLAHEMVHAYDQLRFEVDFRGERDLRQAACTEVGFR